MVPNNINGIIAILSPNFYKIGFIKGIKPTLRQALLWNWVYFEGFLLGELILMNII